MKTGILIGIIALGSAAVAFAAAGTGTDDVGSDPRRGSVDMQGQPAPDHPYALANGTVVCPWQTLPDGTVVCPWNRPDCGSWNGPSNGQAGANAGSGDYRASGHTGCRHWYRWFAPGHSNRCGWSNTNPPRNRGGCCW